jgi:chromatin assembly factor 1 subunit A
MTKDKARERSMSLDPVDFEPSTPTKSKHVSDSDKQAKQAAGKVFLPFMLGQNMRLAPINAFLPADEELVRMNEEMDRFASQPQSAPSPSVEVSFAKLRVARGYQPPKVAQIVQKLYGSSRAPIDLTLEGAETPVDVLKTVPVKFFFYGEDVRPPYRGTWTRTVTSRTARTLALKPLTQALPEVVYDYDSEAEWDDADEGEDIDVEDNEEEEEDEEDMDGFIDDKEAPQYLARRGLPANEVEPICSGLQWEDASGKMRSADPSYPDADFKEFEVCFLLDPSPGTIDPYTTAYWDPEPKQVSSMLPLTSTMGPPRLPLSDRTNGQGTVQSTLVNGKVPKAAKVGPRLVPADVLQAFREAVDGSDLTKIALIEALKKQ